MAAAVVPSRARAAARPAQPTPAASAATDLPVTYVRLTLSTESLSGASLAPPPVEHVLRWRRAARVVKASSAHPVDPSAPPPAPFRVRLSLYARVRRHGPTFISEDPAEPLQTELELCSLAPGASEPTRVAAAAFDIAHFLNQHVAAATKTLPAVLDLSPGLQLRAVVSIKAIGENHLAPYVAPPDIPAPARAPPPRSHSSDTDEVAAALELERLRADVREREGRLERLERATDRLDDAVQQTTRHAETAVPAADLAASNVRIASLEEQLVVADRERAEAERKVSAHVAHAAKIKQTYNQLAAWYNNLREEHSELRSKLPESEGPSDPTRDLPTGVATTHEADYKSLEKERDQLQQILERERTEKKEMHSRNSQLLEDKARTMAELREEWESAQGTLVATQKSSEEKSQRVQALEDALEKLKTQLAERDKLVSERSAELSKRDAAVRELDIAHAEDIRQARAEAAEQAKSAANEEIERLKKMHEEEAQKALQESVSAGEAALERETANLRDAHALEIANVRKQIEEEEQARHEQELASLQQEYDEKAQVAAQESGKAVQDLEAAVKTAEDKLQTVESEKSALEQSVTTLAKERETEVGTVEESHQKQLDELRGAKEDVEAQLRELEEAQSKERESVEVVTANATQRSESLQEELKTAREEIEALRKANEEANSSPRQVAVEENARTEAIEELEGENARLSGALKAERNKREDVVNLLGQADDEHDQLRAMITRLRSERNDAISELKRAKELVPDPNIRTGGGASQNSLSAEAEASSLLEERDKAIRELFRVRKGMNKEIKRLKKENQELADQLEDDSQPTVQASTDRALPESGDIAGVRGQRDAAISDLQKLQLELAALAGSQNRTSTEGDACTPVRLRIESLQSEMDVLKSRNHELEESLQTRNEEHRRDSESLQNERDNIQQELEQAKKSLQTSKTDLQATAQDVDELTARIAPLNTQIVDLKHSLGRTEQERDEDRQQASALRTELRSLKDSLEAAASSSSSTETLLQEAQREIAEGKAKIGLLESEVAELKEKTRARVETLEEEILRLESAVEEQVLSSRDLTSRLVQTEERSNEQCVRLQSERAEQDREASRLESLGQKLQSRNAALTSKLASERMLRTDAEKLLSEVEEKKLSLEDELNRLNAEGQSKSAAAVRLAAEKESAERVLSETQKRLEMAESRLAEQQAELSEVRERLRTVESSREFLQKEASEAGGKSLAISEELVTLRAELRETRGELQNASRSLDAEKQNSSGMISTLKDEKDATAAQLATVQLRLESTEDELRVIRESYGTLESVLQKVQEKATRLGRSATEKSKECSALGAELSEMKHESQQSRLRYETLAEQHQRTRDELSSVLKETGELQSENRSFSDRIRSLETEVGSMHQRLTFVQEENEESLESERAHAEREAKKAVELRKEVRSARAKAEALEAEVEQLRKSNVDLLNATKENGDSRDGEVLNDLINTRIELAYAQEETIRLRNKLKKLAQNGQGSSSFEY